MKTEFSNVLEYAYDYCEQRYDQKLVDKYSRFFREGFDSFGLDESQTHELAKLVSEKFGISLENIFELGQKLYQTGKFELGSIAFLILQKNLDQLQSQHWGKLQTWFDDGVCNWAQVDALCSRITPYFFEKKLIGTEDLTSWKSSKSRWTRRAVPVTLLCLCKTETAATLLKFIDDMMSEPERVVHQGLGWFLRELWKVAPLEVEKFLHKHKSHAARLIFQYATEKMDKEYRSQFKRPK